MARLILTAQLDTLREQAEGWFAEDIVGMLLQLNAVWVPS
jgi:hypothetical protein